jgi:hypothetical protein
MPRRLLPADWVFLGERVPPTHLSEPWSAIPKKKKKKQQQQKWKASPRPAGVEVF